jgi:hypothetical protein
MASNALGRTRTERPSRTTCSLPSAIIRRTERRERCRISATSAAVRSDARGLRGVSRPDLDAAPSGGIPVTPAEPIVERHGGRANVLARSACRVRGQLMADPGRRRHGRKSAEAPRASYQENTLSSNSARSRLAPPLDLRRTLREANDVLGELRNWQRRTWIERFVARHVVVERFDRVEEPGLNYTQYAIGGVYQ